MRACTAVTHPAYTEFKRNPSRDLLTRFGALDSFTFDGLEKALETLRRTNDLDRFENEVLEHLQEAHTRGVILGRNWAGDMAPRELDDELFAGRTVENELAFFDAFLRDIRDGRYSDEVGGYTSGLDNRLRMYGNKVGGTISEKFVLASPDTDTFQWVMLADEHCEDCPRWAAGGPYTKDLLPAYPRDGQSACKVNCKCVVIRSSDDLPSPPPFGLGL